MRLLAARKQLQATAALSGKVLAYRLHKACPKNFVLSGLAISTYGRQPLRLEIQPSNSLILSLGSEGAPRTCTGRHGTILLGSQSPFL